MKRENVLTIIYVLFLLISTLKVFLTEEQIGSVNIGKLNSDDTKEISIVIDNNFVLSEILKTLTNFSIMSNNLIYALTLCVTIIIVSVPEGYLL